MQVSGEVALSSAFYLDLEQAAEVKSMDLQTVPHRRRMLIDRSCVVEFAKSLPALAALSRMMHCHRVLSRGPDKLPRTLCGARRLAARERTSRGLAEFAKSLPALAELTCMSYRLHV